MAVNPECVSVLKPEITGKYSEYRKKEQPTENQGILNAKMQAMWDPAFYV